MILLLVMVIVYVKLRYLNIVVVNLKSYLLGKSDVE